MFDCSEKKAIEKTKEQRDDILGKYNSLEEQLKLVTAQQVENNKKIDDMRKELDDVKAQQRSPEDPKLSGKQSSANILTLFLFKSICTSKLFY